LPATPTARALTLVRNADPGVRRTSMQQPDAEKPALPPLPPPGGTPTTGDPSIAPPGGPEPGQQGRPDPELDDLRKKVDVRPDLTPGDYKASESKMAELSGLIMISDTKFNVNEETGLRREDTPYVLSIDQAFRLALINSRVYQFNLENI